MNELIALLKNFPTDTAAAIVRANAVVSFLRLFPGLLGSAVPARYAHTKAYATQNPEEAVAVIAGLINAITADADFIEAVIADIAPRPAAKQSPKKRRK